MQTEMEEMLPPKLTKNQKNIESKEAVYPPTADKVVEHNKVVGHNNYYKHNIRKAFVH